MGILRVSILSLMVVFLTVEVCHAERDSAKSYYEKGVEYGVQGKFNEAKKEFEKALKIDRFHILAKECLKITEDVAVHKVKSEAAIHSFMAVNYANKGMWDKAIAEFSTAIKINPRYAEAYNYRGFAHVNKGQYDQATLDYNKAIEINPRYAEAYNNRGVAYVNKGQYDLAIFDYNKAIEINQSFVTAYYNRGTAYVNKSQTDQAILDYNKAIEINPRFAEAYYNRGSLYMMKLGNRVKACADWKIACDLGFCENYDLAKRNSDCK